MMNFSRMYQCTPFVIMIFQVRLQYCQVGCEVYNSRKLVAAAVHPAYSTHCIARPRKFIPELSLDFQI